jgi:hypothetical protein
MLLLTYDQAPPMTKKDLGESFLLLVCSSSAAAITRSEMAAVFAFSVIGAVFGSPIGMILAHVLTAPGLEKLTPRQRLALNWFIGTPLGFFSAWYVRDNIIGAQYPIEIAGMAGAFVYSILAVVIALLIWPKIKASAVEAILAWTRAKFRLPTTPPATNVSPDPCPPKKPSDSREISDYHSAKTAGPTGTQKLVVTKRTERD